MKDSHKVIFAIVIIIVLIVILKPASPASTSLTPSAPSFTLRPIGNGLHQCCGYIPGGAYVCNPCDKFGNATSA